MQLNTKQWLAIGVLLLLALSSCFYTVDQREIAIEQLLGKVRLEGPNKPIVSDPGLHMKFPFITTVVYFDTRLQTLGSTPERIPTKEQKFVYVDYFVKWKIKDYYQFYLATGNQMSRVIDLLKPKVSDALKAEFGKKLIEEVVSEDRANIMSKAKQTLISKSGSLGVEIIDMRIKRIDLPVEVRESVYDRMRTKRQAVANGHRYEGQKKSEQIRAAADFNSKKIIAEANKKSEIMRGEADGKAASIYANSFNKDPEFYQFYRSLNAYDNVFNNGENILVLSPDSEFFKYFSHKNQSKG